MTAYTAYGSASSAGAPVFALKPVTYPIRIARIDMAANGWVTFVFYHKPAATISGGTTVTPLPLRGGAPASTITCRSGLAATTISTGTTTITSMVVGSESTMDNGAGGVNWIAQPGSQQYSLPFDYIVAIGDVFIVYIATAAANGSFTPATSGSAAVYFEELRLSWSF